MPGRPGDLGEVRSPAWRPEMRRPDAVLLRDRARRLVPHGVGSAGGDLRCPVGGVGGASQVQVEPEDAAREGTDGGGVGGGVADRLVVPGAGGRRALVGDLGDLLGGPAAEPAAEADPQAEGTCPPPFSWVTDPSATLPVAAASPVLMVAVPLDTLVGPPMTTPTPRSPPVTFWVVEATLLDWLPTALLPPVLASAVPEFVTEPLWEPAKPRPPPPFAWLTAPEELLPAAVADPVPTPAVPSEVFCGAPRLRLTPRRLPSRPVADPVEAVAVLSDWLPTARLAPVPAAASPELPTPPPWEGIWPNAGTASRPTAVRPSPEPVPCPSSSSADGRPMRSWPTFLRETRPKSALGAGPTASIAGRGGPERGLRGSRTRAPGAGGRGPRK